MGAVPCAVGTEPCATRTETCAGRAEAIPARADPIPARTNPCAMRTIGCDFGNRPKITVGSRQQAVGRGRKRRNFRRLEEKLDGKARALSPDWPVPIRPPVILGTKLKKDFRIRAVSSLILIFNSSLITQHLSLPTIVKMLQFPARRRGQLWPSSVGRGLVFLPAYCLLPTAYCFRLPEARKNRPRSPREARGKRLSSGSRFFP